MTMTPEELKKLRIKNLKMWEKGESGNPKGRPIRRAVPYEDIIKKWIAMPVSQMAEDVTLRDFELEGYQLKDEMTLQLFFFLNYLRAAIREAKKDEPSYYKMKDVFLTIKSLLENGMDNTSIDDENILLSKEQQEQVEALYLNMLKDKEDEQEKE